MKLKLELLPSKSLGDFILGMSISDALNIIKQNNVLIDSAQIIFNDNDPLSIDIVIRLVNDGIILLFEPKSQRLRVIEIFDIKKLTLSYRGVVFSKEMQVATFVDIYNKFGPSYPGDFNDSKSIYHLHYPGLSFSFKIPKEFNSLYQESTELPVELPDGTTPMVEKIFIYSGQQMKNPLTILPNQNEDIIICPNNGIYFTKRNCILTFYSSTQDVLSELGPPSKIYHKEDDNMKIHTSTEGSFVQDYFYNYFHLGIDILFDIKTNTVKKFIFHTNFPTHYEFNLYTKCSFKIYGPSTSTQLFNNIKNFINRKSNGNGGSGSSIGELQQQIEGVNQSNSSGGSAIVSKSPPNPSSMNMLEITNSSNFEFNLDQSLPFIHPDLKWDDVQKIYGKSGKPVVNNRGSSSNPFGSTYFYGYSGIIFEVMKNNYIASVCLFKDYKDQH
ncbi:UPF0183 family protein [Tieghemostelium lacteum]|uniref:UPF0183 family protein n=1 Tax=Tieghemostelium lacteum TaxID=361077 RepID=A0A151ZDX5_TIELA|nr:UPF0183 family protein [Tieghemostelium lacteum]|eukprot:KYQ92158.1 UPF0183 family protein [Tieghemostelium lacteum]